MRPCFILLAFAVHGIGCHSQPETTERARVACLMPASERPFWEPIARAFEKSRTGARVVLVEGPNSTDLRENLYTAALLAGDDTFDLVYADVTWTSKFASVGWLRPLDDAFDPAERAAFFEAAIEAGMYRGRLYRVPLRIDLGLLYYRKDLLDRTGRQPPKTFGELIEAARDAQSPPGIWGYVWQGGQYEGLVCVFLEVLAGHGGFWIDPETLEVGLDRPEAFAALDFLRSCRQGDPPVSPPGITTYKEEESRHLFQEGRAVFMRNWIYAWRLAQRGGSRVAGRIGVRPMVHALGESGAATLGGWGLAVSSFSRHPELAVKFVRHAASLRSQRALCGPTGYAPARRDAYSDPELLAANPFLAELVTLDLRLEARPAIPQYALASDILQRRLNAALAGLMSSAEALTVAARETRDLLGRKTRRTRLSR
jgi:multiple sugar transport system substrate-binding protein